MHPSVPHSSAHYRQLVSDLPPSDITKQLKQLGNDVENIGESELVDRLTEAWEEASKKIIQLPLALFEPTPDSYRKFIIVPVELDEGKSVNFSVGTMSSTTLITTQLRENLGTSLNEVEAAEALANDGVGRREKFKLPSLQLGGQTLDLQYALVQDMGQSEDIGGVLGLEFLRKYDVDINFEQQQIAFYPLGCAAPGGLLDTASLSPLTCTEGPVGLMEVNVSLNASEFFPAIVDLTSPSSSINFEAAEHASLSVTIEVTGQGDSAPVSMVPVPTDPVAVTVGNPYMRDTPYQVVSEDLTILHQPEFQQLFQEKPGMLLGWNLWKHKRMVLSLGQNKIWYSEGGPPPNIDESYMLN